MRKKILIFSLFLNLIFVALIIDAVIRRGGISYLKHRLGFEKELIVKKQDSVCKLNEYYFQRKSLFEILPDDQDEIIFLGNSITNGCEWHELFNNPKIKNRGINSDYTVGVLNRLNEIVRAKPKKIFLMIGINDLGRDIPVDTVIINYQKILDTIRIRTPKTEVYIQSVLPDNLEISPNRQPIQLILELNKKLKALASKNKLTFIDLYPSFIDKNGYLDSSLTNDGLHLMGKGYLIWKKIILKYILK
jgi:lysophospholipase L1-like esterase